MRGNLHDGSAQERNTNHEHPAGNNCKEPKYISNWNCGTILRKFTIERMEPTLIRGLFLVRFGCVQIGECSDGCRSSVQWNRDNRNWGSWSPNFHSPQMWWSCAPRIAKNGLLVAIQNCHVWSCGVDSEKGSGFIEALFDFAAETKTGFVSAGS